MEATTLTLLALMDWEGRIRISWMEDCARLKETIIRSQVNLSCNLDFEWTRECTFGMRFSTFKSYWTSAHIAELPPSMSTGSFWDENQRRENFRSLLSALMPQRSPKVKTAKFSTLRKVFLEAWELANIYILLCPKLDIYCYKWERS